MKHWAFVYAIYDTEKMWGVLKESFVSCSYILNMMLYKGSDILSDTSGTTYEWSWWWYMVVGLVNLQVTIKSPRVFFSALMA